MRVLPAIMYFARGLLTAATALLASSAWCQPIRIVTYNVWGLPSPLLRHSERFKQLPEAINALDADVVLIQEAFNGDSDALSRLTRFPFVASGPHRFAHMSSGLLILSRFPIDKTGTFTFSKCGGFDCFASKGAVFARIRTPDAGPVNVFNTHLNANGFEKIREFQADELKKFIEENRDGLPAIVGGDFNGDGAGIAIDSRIEFLRENPLAQSEDLDGFTADPKRNPFLGGNETQRRLDHIYLADGAKERARWKVSGYKHVFNGREGEILSDHFGVRVVAELSGNMGDSGRPRPLQAPGVAEDAGLGKVRSASVVGALSAERTASSEPKLQKPASLLGSPDSKNAPALPVAIPKRLEAIAGTIGLFTFSDIAKQVAFFAEARYRTSEALQLGGSLAFRFQGSDRGWDAAAQFLFGPTFNFVNESGIQNAFFISPKIGPTITRTTVDRRVVASSTHLSLGLSGGKRFALGDLVSYVPSIGLVKDLKSSTNFVIQPVAFSIFF